MLTLPTATSASDEAVRLARDGAPHGTCVLARSQTLGKGRNGHRWLSPEGGLYLAVVLRPNVPMQHLLALTAVGGLGVLGALREAGAKHVALGWPNDLLVATPGASGGAEPAQPTVARFGNLVVDAGVGEGVFAVVGANLNLAPDSPFADVFEPGDFAAEHPLPVTALGRHGVSASAEELAPLVRDAVLARVDAWAADVRAGRAAAGPLAPVLSEYFDEAPLLGHRVRACYADGRVAAEGYLVAVDVWHRVTVRAADGSDQEFAPEQITLRLL